MDHSLGADQAPLIWTNGGLVTAQGAGILAGQPRAFTGGVKFRF